MTTKEAPPLIEAIFEIRWGKITSSQENTPTSFTFDEEERSLLAGVFRSHTRSSFPFYKKVNEQIPFDLPHMARHQYWKSENVWPCIQLGLGVMAVNCGNTSGEYSWENFKRACLEALKFLKQSLPYEFTNLPVLSVELRYQDAFPLHKNETDQDFMKNGAQITFAIPAGFLESDLFTPIVENHHINFSIPVLKPKSTFGCSLDRGQVSGNDGFIQNTVVQSSGALCPKMAMEPLDAWLEEAHTVHKHAYHELIKPTHERHV